MKKWNLIIDVERCENCNNCFMTLKDEYVDNAFEGYSVPQPRHGHRWINLATRERGSGSLLDVAYLLTTCNQCDHAPCIENSRNGAVYKRDDGIVMIDPVKARGQKELVKACPYGHIWWNEEYQVPQKWSWDAHLLDAGWKSPRAVQVCPTGSLSAVLCTDGEMARQAEELQLQVHRPELQTRPRVWYRHLHRFTHEFIAGSLVRDINGLEEVVPGAAVILAQNGQDLHQAVTDYFGDFKFDGLEPDSGEYELRLQIEDCKPKEVKVTLGKSVYLGAIPLTEVPSCLHNPRR